MAQLRDDHSYLMPVHFGGQPGGMPAVVYHDTTVAVLRHRTDHDALSGLLPPGFELIEPELMIAAMMNRGVEWMAGEPYNILAVNARTRFRGNRDDLEGWYSLVVWENKATPILPGREQTGIPKVFGEVEDFRFLDRSMRTWAHYGGHSFCDLHFENVREATQGEREAVDDEFSGMNWMSWRYVPRPGLAAGGGADLSQPMLFPQEFESTRVRLANATVEWSVPAQWKNPTQAHIIAGLAGLPIGEQVGPAIILNAKNILRGDLARPLS